MLNGWLHSVKTGFGVFESRNSPIYCVEGYIGDLRNKQSAP